ncbi:MAG: hypothetical protein A3J48_00555 [Candidatus Doudnabacteria bacterium RIFCSPHIGHO2_02_FULL_46_11]|uniref:VIT family protein n=1 Tax=Candidatus Doudnabacteria bacterium RIFCSPHIGHO2_02_FULL_46_11 TaxID=1817832 RepID=A0A1F5P501_9BACT|nr:MAG: hypothetical protein A3J48_00555 [Candidatus Doudnabacteria bacterium RIFCSPHIGHO2_02_FULL_46_11]
MRDNQKFILYMRNFIFGAEDSLVSTVGLLSGIASVNTPRATIILTGIILIFVEGFSMAIGSFLSEETTDESPLGHRLPFVETFTAGAVMLVTYFATGLIPLAPYLFLEPKPAFPLSIILTLISLLMLGLISAKLLRTNMARSALRMTILGGLAVVIGITVGGLVK